MIKDELLTFARFPVWLQHEAIFTGAAITSRVVLTLLVTAAIGFCAFVFVLKERKLIFISSKNSYRLLKMSQ